MLNTVSTPSSRGALVNSTNHATSAKPRPSPDNKSLTKRRRSHAPGSEDAHPKKRLRHTASAPEIILQDTEEEDEDSTSDSESDLRVSIPTPLTFARARHANACGRQRALSRYMLQPSRPLLSSLVSSGAMDAFTCQSANEDTFLTPPYACAYSNGAKRGGIPHLAVATEQGSVYIWNTERRSRTELAAQRVDLSVHDNGIFDIQWSAADDRLATASADHTTRITDPVSGRILAELRGHSYTVKTIAWDPSHAGLLTTGGRDGSICLWDLRVHDRRLGDDSIIETLAPVATIRSAHEDLQKSKRAKTFAARAVTSVVYSSLDSHGLISSGSANGILRHWDLRFPNSKGKSKAARDNSIPLHMSALDPTASNGARSRGITSLVAGVGPSGSALFALGCDSHIHTYALPSLHPLKEPLGHPQMATNSFYARLALSPCGRWLASGSTTSAAFVFDVTQAASVRCVRQRDEGMQLRAQSGEVTAASWAENALATCSDDGTVRVWRTDLEGRWRNRRDIAAGECDLAWAV